MYKIIKRIIDLLISGFTLIILSPVFIISIILLRITDEGEVFYKQNRVGFMNAPFLIWKFATMLKNSESIGTGSITVRDDPRVTKVGKYLRKSKINELPQIINVFKGDMSIVGPRPLMDKDFDRYPEEFKPLIYQSKPGITGIGSVVFRDEEAIVSNSDMDPQEVYRTVILPYKGALEVWYLNNKSTFTDLKIIFLTAWAIIFPNSDLAPKVLSGLPKRSI